MPPSDPAAEKELARLRRLPENRTCPNCLKEDQLGFMAVCVPFKTFICSDCKSAHQSFSHRCKCAAGSTWQMPEVRALDERQGGGNRVACKRWLSNVPACDRPTENSPPDAFKRFVERAYILEQWCGKGPESPPAEARDSDEPSTTVPSPGSSRPEESEHCGQHHRQGRRDAARDGGHGPHRRHHRHSKRAHRQNAVGPASGDFDLEAVAWPDGGNTESSFPCSPTPSWHDALGFTSFGAGPQSLRCRTRSDPGSVPSWGPMAVPVAADLSALSCQLAPMVGPPGRPCLSFGGLYTGTATQPWQGTPEQPRPGTGCPIAGAVMHRGCAPADDLNPWAEAADLWSLRCGLRSIVPAAGIGNGEMSPSPSCAARPIDPHNSGASVQHHPPGVVLIPAPKMLLDPMPAWMPINDPTNPWADEELRPKAEALSARILVGNT